MDKIVAFIFLTVFDFIVAAVGGHWHYTVTNAPSNTPITGAAALGSPDPITFIDWVGSSVEFMIDLASFGIPGLPSFFTPVFWINGLIWIFLLILIIRGN